MTEGLLLTSLSSFCSLRSISQSLSLAFARQLPLHKGAFDTIKFCPCFLFAFSSSAKPLLNHAIAWFSLYKKAALCGGRSGSYTIYYKTMLFSRQSGASCREYTPPAPLQKSSERTAAKKLCARKNRKKCKQLLS
jgi:hypothetical protein